MRLLPVALLLVTALCNAAQPWLPVTIPAATRASLPATVRMWYRLAWLEVLPRSFELSHPIAAMRGDDLVLRDAENSETAWIIHPDESVTREAVETFIGDWRQPSATELARATAVASGLLPEIPPLRPDQITVSENRADGTLRLEWESERNHGPSLHLKAGGPSGRGRWGRTSCRSAHRCCFQIAVPPAGKG